MLTDVPTCPTALGAQETQRRPRRHEDKMRATSRSVLFIAAAAVAAVVPAGILVPF